VADPQYTYAWDDLERRRLAVRFAYVVAFIGVSVSLKGWVGYWVAFLTMAPAIATGAWCMRFHCPRCSEEFARSRFYPYKAPETGQCVHCGLAIGV
jgi:hypothetical protein